jgi:hypothetical protein
LVWAADKSAIVNRPWFTRRDAKARRPSSSSMRCRPARKWRGRPRECPSRRGVSHKSEPLVRSPTASRAAGDSRRRTRDGCRTPFGGALGETDNEARSRSTYATASRAAGGRP